MSVGTRPRARRRGLIVARAGDETLVYDVRRARALCLEAKLAWLWRRCDGRRGLRLLTAAARRRFGTGEELVDEALVRGALGRLARARLLEEPSTPPALEASARRDFLRRAVALGGLGLLALPAPTAGQAATCVPVGVCDASFGSTNCGGNAGLRCCNQSTVCQRPGVGVGRCRCR